MFYNHCNGEDNVIIIPLPWGFVKMILGGRGIILFVHFRALRFTTNHFPSCLFPSIADDIHIVGPLSIISSTYEHFQTELRVINLFYSTLEMHWN
jgi:hypothetical protein